METEGNHYQSFPPVSSLLHVLTLSFDNTIMKTQTNYHSLKNKFNTETKKANLATSTIIRYQSWIRKYLVYCRKNILEISSESVESFISSYKSKNTKRQAFYALKFFLVRIVNKDWRVEEIKQKESKHILYKFIAFLKSNR